MISNCIHIRGVAVCATMLGVCAALAACSSTPVQEVSTAPSAAAPVSADSRAAGGNASGNASGNAVSQRDAQNRMSVPGNRSVFFEYDQFSIAPDSRDVVVTNGNYLAKATPAKVVIEGNADERGSSEYNLALGQKRAEAVRRALAVSGVPETRMEAISYGKEKPRNTAHDENAWSENRRVDLRY